VDECGGEVTVSCLIPTTIHHKAWNDLGECVETSTTETSYTQTISVVIPENTTQSAQTYTGTKTTEEGGIINYTIYQAAGPCGCCGKSHTTYAYADVNVNCSAHTNEEISVSYTAVTTFDVEACTPITTYGNSGCTINIPCNETTSTKDYPQAGFTVHQGAGPCCPIECNCNYLTASTTSLSWSYDSTSSSTVTFSRLDCIKNFAIGTPSPSHFTALINGNILTVTPNETNMSTDPYVDILTITYDAVGTDSTENCDVKITLTQNGREIPPCDCDKLIIN
jgi:hypothetical protein